MEQQGRKKEWAAPELLVLVRSRPEEQVLNACKFSFMSGVSQTDAACVIVVVTCNKTCESGGPS